MLKCGVVYMLAAILPNVWSENPNLGKELRFGLEFCPLRCSHSCLWTLQQDWANAYRLLQGWKLWPLIDGTVYLIMLCSVEQLAGEAEGSGDNEWEPEAAGAWVSHTLQSEYIITHTYTRTGILLPVNAAVVRVKDFFSLCGCCVQEEMVRLQQNIEELKAASGEDTEEEKVLIQLAL